MIPLLERITGTDGDPQEAPVTTPRPHVYGVPWWAGVYGLDPALPVDDWALAAQCAGMACAVLVFGANAGYLERALSRKGTPADRMTTWLLEVGGEPGTRRRILALRLACEQDATADAAQVLADAKALYDSCSPGRR
jgi:hypothetical protein